MSSDTRHSYLLPHRFKEIVARFPERVALRFPDGKEFSFTEIDQISDSIAYSLFHSGLKSGDVLAIFNEKSELGYCCMLACLKTGIMYTNLDGSSPWSRIEKIIEGCMPNALVYDRDPEKVFEEVTSVFPKLPIINLNKLDIGLNSETKKDFLNQNFHGGNPAYIMFTSGSTGFPKGACISHSNLLNFIDWGESTFLVSETDVFTNANPIYFDNSVFDFYVSIFNGATLVPISHSLAKDPKKLVEAINKAQCTIWFSVPSLLVYLLTTKALGSDDFTSITRISFGGEGFAKSKLKKLFQLFGHRMQLINVYGPTECTCICSSYMITESDFEDMTSLAPLGLMAPNFGFEILPTDSSTPNMGELCLTGPGVGLGYFNDPERTAKSFVQNPNVSYHEIMYRTGDLVELKTDGMFHFKGRADNQIKHMGYRIELEEIEAAFNSLGYVNEVGVIYERINTELGQIKAFVSVDSSTIELAQIQDDIKQIIPSYMVPRVIEIMDVLPKNKNGKIDRAQLKMT